MGETNEAPANRLPENGAQPKAVTLSFDEAKALAQRLDLSAAYCDQADVKPPKALREAANILNAAYGRAVEETAQAKLDAATKDVEVKVAEAEEKVLDLGAAAVAGA